MPSLAAAHAQQTATVSPGLVPCGLGVTRSESWSDVAMPGSMCDQVTDPAAPRA